MGSGTIVGSPGTSDLVDTGLSGGTTYYYKVTAIDDLGNESDPSDEVSATTLEDGGGILGDVDGDGDIDIVDALQVARFDAGLNPSPFNGEAADVNGGSAIDILDALQIARYDAGLIGSFE